MASIRRSRYIAARVGQYGFACTQAGLLRVLETTTATVGRDSGVSAVVAEVVGCVIYTMATRDVSALDKKAAVEAFFGA